VSIIRGEFARDPAASVTGTITEGDFQVNFWDWGVFWAFIWMGTTLTILVAGVIFAAVGSKQLKASGDTITSAPGPALLGAAAAWLGLALLMLFQTQVGLWTQNYVRFTYAIPGVILAQFMVACAFAIRTMMAAFAEINPRQEQVALTLGCTRAQAFWRVVLPEARRGMIPAATGTAIPRAATGATMAIGPIASAM
jgi:ABC-type Fe3+ transport system permease subunit